MIPSLDSLTLNLSTAPLIDKDQDRIPNKKESAFLMLFIHQCLLLYFSTVKIHPLSITGNKSN